MPPFKDEHILIIAPGSQSTLAQLGLPESFTPATTRLKTRMFQAPDGKTWEPYKIRPIKKQPAINGDVQMGGVGDTEEKNDEEEQAAFEEDIESDEGAVYPLTGGRIINMPAFLALLNHVHYILSPTLHTPILLIAQPAWTAQDHEALTQFFFEKFKTPAFCIMDSALAVSYGYGVQNSTVIDIGFQKVDVTTVVDFAVQMVGRTIALPECGGDAMTRRLQELLAPKGFTYEMSEQLKKSPFCEILPTETPLPGGPETEQPISNPAAAASTGATSSGPSVKIVDPPRGIDADLGEDELEGEKVVDDEGVLDVASIVASGKTQEFLAAQEKKKAAAAGRKAAKDAREAADAAAAKPQRLPNSKREKIIFHYQERKAPEVAEGAQQNGKPPADEADEGTKKLKTPERAAAAGFGGASGEAAIPQLDGNSVAQEADIPPVGAPTEALVPVADSSVSVEDQAAKREQLRAAKREEKRKAREGQGDPTVVRKEVEVGTERFLAASNGLLDKIADAVHRTILSSDDISKRSDLWDSLIIVGNGSRIRGFKDALLSLLNIRYLISPSSATIFTSELPSNLSTPMGTGAQTPQRDYPPGQHPLPTGSSVNPLLLAATTASMPGLNPNMPMGSSFGGAISHSHSSHSQSPSSIKTVKAPEYFPEFKNDGFEESVFLGAQVAAKVIFVQDQGVSNGFLSRVQYNEMGPSGIHEIGLAF